MRALPIEIWDLPVAGRALQRWRHDASFPSRVAEAVASLREHAPSHFSADARTAAAAFHRVHVLGGAAEPAFVAVLQECGFAAQLDPDPLYSAARAGHALAPGVDLCADVGQTSIKLCDGARAWRVDRDFTRAPFRDDVPLVDRERARASTLAFVSDTLRAAGHAGRIVVGLPCELDVEGRPRGCSYCWPDPDPAWRADMERSTGAAIQLFNDAELAALAAARAIEAPALVLTIGFGVGAAFLVEDER